MCQHLHQAFSLTAAMVAGAEIKISRPVEDKNPVVIARLGRDPSKRTVAFYGHYDVQPAMEREWTTNPFEMNAIDGYYYGRGTSDNKVGVQYMAAWSVLLAGCRVICSLSCPCCPDAA